MVNKNQTPVSVTKLAAAGSTSLTGILPTQVFPAPIREYILEYKKHRGWSKNHSATAVLMAASSAIGNTYRVVGLKSASSSLYAVLVGPPSTAKSDIAEAGLDVIAKQQDELYEEYNLKYREYEDELLHWKSLKPRERHSSGQTKPNQPKPKHLLIDKTTPQAFGEALMYSRRAVTLYKDEIASFVSNVDNEMKEDLLKCWSNFRYSYGTKTRGHNYVSNPFLNIFGTIQPKRLSAFTKNKGVDSGFSMRFLYTFPENSANTAYGKVDEHVTTGYNNVIGKLYSLELSTTSNGTPVPTDIHFDPIAFSKYEEWRIPFSEKAVERDDLEREIMGKMQQYSLRFALILQLMYWAAGEESNDFIGLRAVEGAIKLTKYFLQSSLMAHQQMITPVRNTSKVVQHHDIIRLFNAGGTYKTIKEAGVGHERDIRDAVKLYPDLLTDEAKSRLRKLAS